MRGLERLNFDAMAYLWLQGTPPLLRIRHVDFRHRTWTTSWGSIMALTATSLVTKVRMALQDDFELQTDHGLVR